MFERRLLLFSALPILLACGSDEGGTPLSDAGADSTTDPSEDSGAEDASRNDGAQSDAMPSDSATDTPATDAGPDPQPIDLGEVACAFGVVDGCFDCMATSCADAFAAAFGDDPTTSGGECAADVICLSDCGCDDECVELCLEELSNECDPALGGVFACAEDECEDACSASECGDGRVTGPEFCEASTLPEDTDCTALGAEGELRCTDECQLDLSGCDFGVTREDGTCEAPIVAEDTGTLDDDGWLVVVDSTAEQAPLHNGSCSEEFGRELVFTWTPEESGRAVALMAATGGAAGHGDPLVHVRTNCADIGSEVGCNDDSPLSDTLDSFALFDAEAGTTYFVFADGYDLEEDGEFELKLRIEED